jgi:large subunit ribosomal protein L10
MNRVQKAELIDSLTKEFSENASVFVCDYKGMTVSETEALRNELKTVEAKSRVVKNTLAKIALDKTEHKDLELNGTNFLIWGNDQISIAKKLVAYAKDLEKSKAEDSKNEFVIKGASIEGEIVDAKGVDTVSKLPGRQELLGMLAYIWSAPAQQFAYALNALPTNFATALNNLKEKKEQEV